MTLKGFAEPNLCARSKFKAKSWQAEIEALTVGRKAS